VFLSAPYVTLQRVLQLLFLLFRSMQSKDLEIIVLRHVGGAAPPGPASPVSGGRRLFLSAASRLLPRVNWSSFIVTPATLSPLATAPGGEAALSSCSCDPV